MFMYNRVILHPYVQEVLNHQVFAMFKKRLKAWSVSIFKKKKENIYREFYRMQTVVRSLKEMKGLLQTLNNV